MLFRGEVVKIEPRPGHVELDVDRMADQGWVDLRPDSWVRWRDRCLSMLALTREAPGVDRGSRHEVDLRAWSGRIRPGALAAMVLRIDEGGERIKR